MGARHATHRCCSRPRPLENAADDDFSANKGDTPSEPALEANDNPVGVSGSEGVSGGEDLAGSRRIMRLDVEVPGELGAPKEHLPPPWRSLLPTNPASRVRKLHDWFLEIVGARPGLKKVIPSGNSFLAAVYDCEEDRNRAIKGAKNETFIFKKNKIELVIETFEAAVTEEGPYC